MLPWQALSLKSAGRIYCLVMALLWCVGLVPAQAPPLSVLDTPTTTSVDEYRPPVDPSADDTGTTVVFTEEELAFIQSRVGRPIRVGCDTSRAPIEFRGTDGSFQGISRDYLELLKTVSGLEYTVVDEPSWLATLEAARNGDIDMICAIHDTPDRRSYLRFTKPYLEFPIVLIVDSRRPMLVSLHDLHGHRVSVVSGSYTHELLKQHHAGIRIVAELSTRAALRAVADGRSDAFLGDIATAQLTMRSAGLDSLVVGGQTDYTWRLSMGVVRGNPALASIVGKVLASTSRAARLEIHDRWVRVQQVGETPEKQVRMLYVMRERLRELQCIYAISDALRTSPTIPDMLSRTVLHIPTAFTYNEIATCRIVFDRERYLSRNFREGVARIRTPILVGGIDRGYIEVFYREHRPVADQGPFLREEHALLENVAKMIGEAVERHDAADRARARGLMLMVAIGAIALIVAGIYFMTWWRRQAAERERSRLALAASERRFRDLVANLDAVVYRCKPDGIRTIEYVSEGMNALFGHSADTWRLRGLPKGLNSLPINEDQERVRTEIRAAMEKEGAYELEYRTADMRGETHWVLDKGRAVRTGPKNELMYIEGVIFDVTRAKTIEAELAEARDKAEAATHTKAQFLATMSHEIRTPLNAIINMTSLTLDTELNRKQTQYLQTVYSSARGLLALINDILDFSKIEAGKLDIEAASFDLRLLLEEITDTFRDRVLEKGVELIVMCEPNVPRFVVGDVHRLRQVLLNLVGNAFKFTDRGEVVVRVQLREAKKKSNAPSGGNTPAPPTRHAAGSNVQLEFSVRDTGIGIPEDKRDRLFNAFSQIDGSIARKYGGTGLGLVICRQLIRLLGSPEGIVVSSKPGEGSMFAFTLPFVVAPDGAEQPHVFPPQIRAISVLIIEDNESSRFLLEMILKSFGMNPMGVASAEEGLALLEARPGKFDLVITDWRLPGIDGIEALRRLRARETTRSLPVVLTSSFAREMQLNELPALGNAAFAPKPLKPSLVYDAILEAFQVAGHPATRTKPLATEAGTFKGVRILLAEDNEANQFVAQEVLGSVGIQLEIAENGDIAVRRAQAEFFDIILMDIHMPGMDGLEATRALRTQGYSRPILAMTANAMREDEQTCLRAGMDDYISKPIDRPHLLQTLRKWLPASRYQLPRIGIESGPPIASPTSDTAPAAPGADATLAPPAPGAGTPAGSPAAGTPPAHAAATAAGPGSTKGAAVAANAPGLTVRAFDDPPSRRTPSPLGNIGPIGAALASLDGIDAARALARLQISAEAFRRMLLRFSETQPLTLQALRKAAEDGDCAEVRRHAHSLAGAAGNIEATALFRSARALEAAAREGQKDAFPPLLDTLAEEAARVLASLMILSHTEAPTAQSTGVGTSPGSRRIPLPALLRMLEELDAHLTSFDLNAITKSMSELESLILPSALQPQVKQLHDAVHNYDHYAAAQITQKLMKTILETIHEP